MLNKQNMLRSLTTTIKVCMVAVFFQLMSPSVTAQKIYSVYIKDGINPATAEFIMESIEQAEKAGAEAFLLKLNTPGGLLTSTRDIVTKILDARVPVIVFVAPSGAHAGSAGVFITLSANIAAMAPGTNIGAAHPVSMQGKADAIMMEKGTNDAAAFIRTIAEKRGRNVQWAEDAVRLSKSITEKEALEMNVINLIATNEEALLNEVNGKSVEINGKTKVLNTTNAKIVSIEPGFFQQVLSRLSDPNIAYILMMLGFYGLLFELFSPGAIFPGIAGVICLILAFYSMSAMPVNYAGIGLIIFGIVLFLLEIKVVSHGILAIGGIISVLLGSMILFRSSPVNDYVSLSWSVIIAVTLVSGAFFALLVTLGLKAQRAKTTVGQSGLIGKTAITLNDINPNGQVRIMGETWGAVSLSGEIKKDQRVVIKDLKGLTLYVTPETEQQPKEEIL